MAERFIVIIPADPKAELPTNASDIRDLLAEMAGTAEARVKDYGKLQFIDAGENAGRIACPDCDTELLQERWRDWMNEDWHSEDGFHLHKHDMPCCSASPTLDNLVYVPMQGFARWLVSARDTGRGALTPSEVAQLESLSGVKLRAIAQRY